MASLSLTDQASFFPTAGLLPKRLPTEWRRAEEEEEAGPAAGLRRGVGVDLERGARQEGGQEELLPHRRHRQEQQGPRLPDG